MSDFVHGRIAPGFAEHLQAPFFSSLEQSADTAYALTRDLQIAYYNPAYISFAAANGEAEITARFAVGTFLGAAITAPLRDFYLQTYAWVCADGKRWDHIYECSSGVVYRMYQQSAYPLGGQAGLVVVNHLLVERSHHSESPSAVVEAQYRKPNGMISQCSHCRCVQRSEQREQWDWVGDWVDKTPEDTSHSLCKACWAYYHIYLPSRLIA